MSPSIAALARDVFYEKSVRVAYREAMRRLEKDLKLSRPGSFPFISADTYRLLCDVVIEGDSIIVRNRLYGRSVMFFDLSLVDKRNSNLLDSSQFDSLLGLIDRCESPPVLIFHNGDIAPNRGVLEKLQTQTHHIFSSNIVHETPKLTPLPVGLENRYRNNNGVLADFHSFRDTAETRAREQRVFASFNPSTNREVRDPVVRLFASSRFGWNPARISSPEYRKQVLNSKFVISPPGNGFDCHRTWESIYLGAVPVVLKEFAPVMFSEELPILAVENYSEFIEMSDAALDEAFDVISRKSKTLAFMTHWFDLIASRADGHLRSVDT